MLQGRAGVHNRFHAEAVDDGLRRLLSPAVLREIRMDAMLHADEHAIDVFSANLGNLLMAPPIRGTRVLGVDPGIRTGTKCAALDETGKFLGYFVVNQERDPEGAKKAIAAAVKEHGIRLIAVGNGTASHEVRKVVAEAIAENGLEAQFTVVDEDGASVYSASDVAREEFPELDLTIRGAISIGHRLQDPLAELVKIEPKSIGVGLYQHDVNQRKLSETLDEVVGSVVNRVGVNINTASASLLKYVSGVNASLARKIVKHRDGAGKIRSREELRGVSGMGPKSFEQCAGFLKVPESENPLDNTWVHPERYALAMEIQPFVKSGSGIPAGKREELKAKFGVGDATINDVSQELAKPGRDPREGFPPPVFSQGVVTFEDLKEGMKVTGKVKNVVDFGAFVDIGIKESALVHVSELSVRFVKDPMEVLKAGDVREFRILSLDMERRRIGLSLKPEGSTEKPAPAGQAADRPKTDRVPDGRRGDGRKGPRQEPRQGTQGDRRGPRTDPRGGGHNRDDRQGPGREPRQGPRQGPIPSAPVQKGDTVYNPFAELLKNRKK
jgi:protein Tex